MIKAVPLMAPSLGKTQKLVRAGFFTRVGALWLAIELLYFLFRKNPKRVERIKLSIGPKMKEPWVTIPWLPEYMHRFLSLVLVHFQLHDKLHDNMRYCHNVFGKTMYTRILFLPPVISTECPRNVEYITKKNFRNYPKGVLFRENLQDMLGDGIFTADGENWLWQRKKASPSFTHSSLSLYMYGVFHEHADHLVAELLDAENKEIDLYRYLQRFTLDSICHVGFGIKMGALTSPDMPFIKAFDDAQSHLERRFFWPPWKLERFLRLGYHERRVMKDCKIIREFATNVVRSRFREMGYDPADADVRPRNSADVADDTSLDGSTSAETTGGNVEQSKETPNANINDGSRSSPIRRFIDRTLGGGGNTSTHHNDVNLLSQQKPYLSSKICNDHVMVYKNERNNNEPSMTADSFQAHHSSNPQAGKMDKADMVSTRRKMDKEEGLKNDAPRDGLGDHKEQRIFFSCVSDGFSKTSSGKSTHTWDTATTPAQTSGRDFLSIMINAEKGEKHTEKFWVDVAINFIIAGRDTTSLTLSWLFYEVLCQPRVLEKLKEEWSGLPKDYTVDDLDGMQYTRAVIDETLRLHPPVPLNVKMAVNDDTLPDGTYVPKGSQVLIATYCMGRNKEVWGEDAEEFRPERWLTLEKRPDQFQFPVFHAGPRLCLGHKMAYLEMTVCMLRVFQKLDIIMTCPPEDVTYRQSITLGMRNEKRPEALPVIVRQSQK